jgi:DNA-directed RNA polymerase subunit RPC12/RpoP
MLKCAKCGAMMIVDEDTDELVCPNGCTLSDDEDFDDEMDGDVECDNSKGRRYLTVCPKCGSDKIAYEEDECYYFCSECGNTFNNKGKHVYINEENDNEGYGLGFVLSLFLSIIGLVIAYFIAGEKKGFIRGAVHGIITEVVIAVVATVLSLIFTL